MKARPASTASARSAPGPHLTCARQRLSFGAIGTCCLLALLGALHLWALLSAPAAWMSSGITVTLQPGQALVLGRHELGAPRAGMRQLMLRRDAQGAWLLRNLDPSRPLLLRQRGATDQRSSDVVLARGQRLQAGATVLTVVALAPGRVTLSDGQRRWDYDGANVLQDGAPQPACPGAPLASRVLTLLNRGLPTALDVARPLRLGGLLYCGNRLASSALEAGHASLVRLHDGRIALSARGAQPLLVSTAHGWEDAAQRDLPLAASTSFAVGRTLFTLAQSGATLRLTPSGQVALSSAPQILPQIFPQSALPPAVRWEWQARRLLALPTVPVLAWAAAGAVLLLGASTLLAGRGSAGSRAGSRAGILVGPLVGTLIAAAGMLLLVSQRSGGAPGAGISLLLAWATLCFTLWYALGYWRGYSVPSAQAGAQWQAGAERRQLGLLPASAVLLLGSGLLIQLDMGLGASDSGWLRHFQNSSALLALGLPGALLLARLGRRRCTCNGTCTCSTGIGIGIARPATERLLLAMAALALGGVLLQVCFGNETGVFELQPVEFAKLALAALSAHCLALVAGGATHQRRNWRFWLRMAAPVLLFLFLLALALVRVDDYSPLVLLLVWSGALALAWCASRGRRAALLAGAGAACLLLGGALALRSGGELLADLGFYPERFQVWQAPAAHPHTGQQMLLGARAIAQGGWRGMDGAFGLATLGGAAGDALAIPAIQDDFAPTFLLQRHGLAAGLALWSLQALFVAALLRSAAGAWGRAQAARDFRRAWLGRFQYFALCGGAAFVAGHLLLSWGTNLAIFPIMGQPMSFLSAGGSHLLFFICPLLAFGMASTPLNEEIASCRSMSNTKS